MGRYLGQNRRLAAAEALKLLKAVELGADAHVTSPAFPSSPLCPSAFYFFSQQIYQRFPVFYTVSMKKKIG